ncbi:uncharacterized protein LOC105689369 isoform X2 [Athalia rosae]|uniref:uncharacterized protein LOC105689369 isoform X2 n=1 Tax=Athalia rosae TaxID=37344 RepID=UPI000625D07F|nr:uncharacterized protein LOC105689369 isoform X2 [Athalia rosae]
MCIDIPGSKMRAQDFEEDVEILEAHVVEQGSLEKVTVKQEKPDDAEIRELAAKMVEANKAKMGPAVAGQPRAAGLASQPNLPGILSYLSSNLKRPADSSLPKPTQLPEGKLPLDDDSQRGRFGWTSFGKCHIPYIFRAGEKYCAVRILESKLLNKYLGYLHADIYSCTCIRSYYITEAESKLFNEINIKHCENQFGRDLFTCKDLVVRLADAREFYTFLDMCYTKLTAGAGQNASSVMQQQKAEKCGFIRINKESVVPYTVKDGLKYVPLFYFEGETDNLKLKAEKLEGWDLSYLKFCCKVQGIRNELFASETCSVISLSDIKSYFPPGTGFEDYWPSKVMDSQLLVSSKGGGSGGGWTKQPPTPPAAKQQQQQQQQTNVQNNTNHKNSLNLRGPQMPNVVPRGINSNATIQRVVQPRPVVTTHLAHSSPSRVSPARNNSIAQQPMLNAVQAACNGWPGLVGGQPTFQTALVSQASHVIRMTNAPLNMHNQIASSNKSYSQQSRSRGGGSGASAQYPGVYPATTMQAAAQAQPPPLVRATAHSSQPNIGYPTYGKDDWAATTYTTPSLGVPSAVSPSTYPHNLLNLNVDHVHSLMPQTQNMLTHPSRHTPPGHNSATAKYPPPLIPVNGSSNNVNFSRDSRGRKPLIPISDTPTSGSHVPYKVQKALVDEKMVPCINAKPYIYTELLMTLPDFVSQYFPTYDIDECRQVLTNVLGVDLYQGNRQQMQMLMDAGKCSSINEELPLIQVRSLMRFMPQMKYVFTRRNTEIPAPAHSSEEHPPKKRQRTS